jgi:hypothetical protein
MALAVVHRQMFLFCSLLVKPPDVVAQMDRTTALQARDESAERRANALGQKYQGWRGGAPSRNSSGLAIWACQHVDEIDGGEAGVSFLSARMAIIGRRRDFSRLCDARFLDLARPQGARGGSPLAQADAEVFPLLDQC